jgi:hypothetical protein
MTSQQILAWAMAHPELAVVAAGAVLSIPGSVYAVVKTVYQRVTGRAAKGRVWTTLDVIAEVLPNLPGAINRAVRGAGLPSIFAPPSRDTVAPPPPSDPQRGAVRVGALLAICGGVLLATLAGAVLTGCPKVIREPSLPPPPDGCVAGSTLCHEGAPWRCGPEGRWSQADRRCDRLSGADGGTAVLCCATPSALQPGALVHACVPANVCAPEVSP